MADDYGWVTPVAGVGLVVAIVAGVFYLLNMQPPAGGDGGGGAPPKTLTVAQGYGTILGPEPDGTYIATLGFDIEGGVAPYNVTITWSDGTTETLPAAAFERTFPGVPTSSGGTVVVTSSDGQTAHASFVEPFS